MDIALWIDDHILRQGKFKHIFGILLLCFYTHVLADTPTAAATATAPTATAPGLMVLQLPNFQNLNLSDFEPAITTTIEACNHAIDKALQGSPSWQTTMQPVLEQVNNIKGLWNLLLILNNVEQSAQTTATLNSLLPKVADFHNKLMHNVSLYQAFVAISKSKDFAKLSSTQQIILQQIILDYQLSGANLTPAQQDQYIKIVQQLRDLATNFNNNLAAATNSWQYYVAPEDAAKLNGVPDFIKATAALKAKTQGKNGWILTLDDNCLVAVESYAKNRDLRELMYKAFVTLASPQDPDPKRQQWDNTSIVAQTLALRQQLANLLGLDNYALYANADRQPPNPTQALQFLEDLAASIKPAAEQEFAQLKIFAKQDKLNSSELQPWDVAYYAQWDKSMIAADSLQKSKEYFQAKQVVQGAFNLASILFNVDFNAVKDAATWHDDVTLYSIVDVQNNTIGYVYLDLYARSDKNPKNRTQMYITRLNAKKDQLPVAVISTNFLNDGTGLIRHDEVVGFFIEFGDMLQRCLATMDYPSFSGTNGMTWDAIAFASQFMQYWAWQKEYLQDIAVHYKTGTKIPDDLLNTLTNASNFDAAIDLLQQLQLAILDLRIHLNLDGDKDKTALEIFNDIRNKYDVLPTLKVDNFPNRFSETFTTDYAATYYTYYWDKTLAADAFAAFSENDLFSAKIGHQLRDTILQQGGQASILDLFKKFRGRAPQNKYLLTQEDIS